ncbi:hypothetical protein M758_3G203500 [Ceratodon purpureus]|nr:hypothetical protein M758_3G203500 [Ceratodon purpureus]KAG0623802.1 hypothetical protein M758_3G203500 [Ceratodon purpureus]KAG0623803.1 hypothetical protein M758_3G203500 [Ceratodon purpureus]
MHLLRGQRKVVKVIIATSMFWIFIGFLFSSSQHHIATAILRPSIPCPTSSNILQEYPLPVFHSDQELLRHAFHRAIEGPPGPGHPRIAFLFVVRGPIPLEPVWRKYLQGHEHLWSLYVHPSNPVDYKFPPSSLFHEKEIPSKPVARISMSLVDAIRRLLAYALADPRYNNTWFVNICESTSPIRSFPAAYHYLTNSHHSFVEAFLPDEKYQQWETTPEFPISELRKGETWMQMTRKHATIVVSDKVIYSRFAASCSLWCAPDEEYFQTLLHLEDGAGIANRTTMWTDWKEPRVIAGSPRLFGPGDVSEWLFKEIRKKTREWDGLKQDSALDKSEFGMTPICEYNGIANSPCYLFARKFDSNTASAILDVISKLPGF